MFFSNVTNNNFKTAIYIRLSREDGDKQESESIGNQRDIIKRYIKENGLQFVDEYVDDGISGTTFDRPGFNKLIRNIEERKHQYGNNKRLIKIRKRLYKNRLLFRKLFSRTWSKICSNNRWNRYIFR